MLVAQLGTVDIEGDTGELGGGWGKQLASFFCLVILGMSVRIDKSTRVILFWLSAR